MKKVLLLAVFIGFAAAAIAQPSLNLSVGPVIFMDGQDKYALSEPWPAPGSQTEDGTEFFTNGSGFHLKAGLGWEFSDYFSAGLAYQMLNVSATESFRKADITSIGVQFRVNFTNGRKQWVPFFQAAVYLSNSQTYTQEQATSAELPSQTQPAITASGTSSFAFNADFGLEYALMKTMGVHVMAGISGFDPLAEMPAGVDYSPYFTPTRFSGGLYISASVGVKYYFGRGGKKRDF